MTEYCRIEGLNDINFDQGATGPYRLTGGRPPKGLDKELTRQEIISRLSSIPEGIAGYILDRGLSVITITFNVQGDTDAEMEQYRHDLTETLVDAALYIETNGARGTTAAFRYKMDNAAEDSYKTIFYGAVDEAAGRDVLGAKVKESLLENMTLTLYCEPRWRPALAITLGPNEIYCPSFEEDGNADGRADNWAALGAPILALENTIVLHGCYSQRIQSTIAGDGIISTTAVAPVGVTEAVAYAWICRPTPGTDVYVVLRDTTAGANRGWAWLDTPPPGGWEEAIGKDGNTWYRVDVFATGILAGNNHELRIQATLAAAVDWYADKTYWKWAATEIPDEWCDHWLLFNHTDDDEGHQNYFDVDDLKGDVAAPTRIRLTANDGMYYKRKFAMIARRTVPWPCQLPHFLEGENGALSNWGIVADVERSNAQVISDAANATGNVIWTITTDLETYKGRLVVFASVWTDDIDNTYFRLRRRYGSTSEIYGTWERVTKASEFQLLRLGSIQIDDHFFPTGASMTQIVLQVTYQKDPTDTAKLDYVMLVSEDEAAARIEPYTIWVDGETYDRLEADHIKDFRFVGIVESGTGDMHELAAYKGDRITMQPVIENRLYFKILTVDAQTDPWDDHIDLIDNNGAPAFGAEILIDYLPQYTSPLE